MGKNFSLAEYTFVMKNALDTLGIFQMFAIPFSLLETEGIFLSFTPWETSDVSIGKTHESVSPLKTVSSRRFLLSR